MYRLHGLRFRSILPLPGRQLPGVEHDVSVIVKPPLMVPSTGLEGCLILAYSIAGRQIHLASTSDAGTMLRVPGVCDFKFDPSLSAIECRPDPSANLDLISLLLGGVVIALLLNLRGSCVLHASAVVFDGSVLAIAGYAGAGKSTLAAMLCGSGGKLVTDDVLRVDLTPAPICAPGSTTLRLREQAAWALEFLSSALPATVTPDGRLGLSPAMAEGDTFPLAVVVLPRLSRSAQCPEIKVLNGADAFVACAGIGRIQGWVDPVSRRREFHNLAALSERVSVIEAVLPWGPGARGQTAFHLLECLRRTAGVGTTQGFR